MIIAISMDLSAPIDRMLLGWSTLTSGRKSGCPQIEFISDVDELASWTFLLVETPGLLA
jgi:hypothetical protein